MECSLECFYSSEQKRNGIISDTCSRRPTVLFLLSAFEANSKIPNWLLGTGFWLLVDKRKHAETNWRMESSGLKGKPAARGNDTQRQREAARMLNAKTFTLRVRIHIHSSKDPSFMYKPPFEMLTAPPPRSHREALRCPPTPPPPLSRWESNLRLRRATWQKSSSSAT